MYRQATRINPVFSPGHFYRQPAPRLSVPRVRVETRATRQFRAEWEYVARAGSTTTYYFGDDIDSSKANYDDEFRKTTAVGSYPGNAFGLHDMHGNASEWVEDCWVDNYRQVPVSGAAMTAGPCKSRVLRGGTWDNEPQYLRSAFRHGYFAEFRLSGIGFRVAKTL